MTPSPQARPQHHEPLPRATLAGLIAGLLAAVAAVVVPDQVAQVPFGMTFLHVGLAAGLVGLADTIHRRTRARANDAWIAACTPMLAIPLLVARLLDPATLAALPRWVSQGLVAEAFLVALILGVIGLGGLTGRPGRWAPGPWTLAIAGTVLVAGLIGLHLATGARPPGGLAIGAIALAGTGVALCAQVLAAGRLGGPWSALARAPALIVAGVHLSDGLVAYLAVSDPFGLAPRAFSEQTPFSAFLLATVGLGYPLAKWGLGVAIAYLFDVRGPEDGHSMVTRWGAYMFTILLGLYPGLFSLLHVLG